jgi:hypothetical protein
MAPSRVRGKDGVGAIGATNLQVPRRQHSPLSDAILFRSTPGALGKKTNVAMPCS